jgi:hypothetical protein
VGRNGGNFDDVDWLDDGSEVTVGPTGMAPPRLQWPRWFTLAVAVLAVAAVVAVLNTVRRTPPPAAPVAVATTPASSSRPAPTTSAPLATPSPSPISVLRLGHPLLGVTAGWELFARGVDALVRIQPAAGRVTLTPVPDLRSGGPVYLLAGPDRVVIRPLDNVPAYVVPDDRPASQLPLTLNAGGPVFPGPEPGQMWVGPTDDRQPVMALATLDGKRLPDFVQVPAGSSSFDAAADGAGYLLFSGIGGEYAARPDGLHRISTGALLAVGPTGWLVAECDERYRCQAVLIGRADGSRRIVPIATGHRDRSGVISPDGTTVAMMVAGPSASAALYLFDLAAGGQRTVNVAVNQETLDGAIAFSPDSKWLFVVTDTGELSVVNCRTGAVSALGVPLPTLSQLVVRPASY